MVQKEKQPPAQNGFLSGMFNTDVITDEHVFTDDHAHRLGFTLIEILVAIALIAIMATIVIPNIRPRAARDERKQFISKFNTLLQLAQHDALMTGKTQKIFIDLEKKVIQLQTETGKVDAQNEPIFEPPRGSYFNTTFSWPKNLDVKNFYIEGYDELERWGGRSAGKVWFFIVPSGLTQTVIINVLDTNDKKAGQPRPIGLVLNPFSAQFKEYDSFQK